MAGLRLAVPCSGPYILKVICEEDLGIQKIPGKTIDLLSNLESVSE